MKRLKLKVGGIFRFQVDEEQVGYGQILKIRHKTIIVIGLFDGLYHKSEEIDISEVIKKEIVIFGNTFNVYFNLGNWVVVDNSIVGLEKIKYPYYKFGTPPDVSIEDFDEKYIRKAKPSEYDKLNYRPHTAPIRFEKAFKAFYGLLPWDDDYEEMLYKNLHKFIP